MFDGQERQMALKYNGAQREEYLNMIGRVGNHWLDVFEGRPEFYSAISGICSPACGSTRDPSRRPTCWAS